MTQSISRCAKPIGYYVSNQPIDALGKHYGYHLENISPQQKMLMVSAIADHMASAHTYYPMQSSIECIDPDNLLGDNLKLLLVEIANASDAEQLNSLILAIASQHGDNIRNGAYA